jgi:heme/copper-type cytochrome/quinol oxidase subunit 2
MTTRRALLLLVLLLPLLLQGASLAHTHFGGAAGFYNQEHDLTLLATVGAVAQLVAAVALVVIVVVATHTARAISDAPALASVVADSRAPPTV